MLASLLLHAPGFHKNNSNVVERPSSSPISSFNVRFRATHLVNSECDQHPQADGVFWASWATKSECPEAHTIPDKLSFDQQAAQHQEPSIDISSPGLHHPPDKAPDFAALASLLKRYGKAKALSDGRFVHDFIRRQGYEQNTFLGNCLVQMYGNCGTLELAQAVFDKILNPNVYSWTILLTAYAQNGYLEEARSVFTRMPERDVVSWNAMIAGYAQHGDGEEALNLFQKMHVEGVEPDKATFICGLDACASQEALEEGRIIHSAVLDYRYEQHANVENALINMYGKCKSVHDARSVFGSMSQQDVISWSAMIAAYHHNGQNKEALDLFFMMRMDDLKPNKITFLCALNSCASLLALEDGLSIHAAIVDHGYEGDLMVATSLVNMYGKCSNLPNARTAFDKMPERNVVSWSTMITAYSQNGMENVALDLFKQMQLGGIEPDKVTFMCVLEACTALACQKAGQEVHAAIVQSGFEQDHVLGTALISMYARCGGLHDARTLFRRRCVQDVITWCAMIAACSQNAYSQEAVDLFWEMQLCGIKANKVTLICAIDACSGLVSLQEGQVIHRAVVDMGYEQDIVVGNALIDMYGKCGSMHHARTVFCRMPQRDVVTWTSMIAAYAQNGHGKESLNFYHQMLFDGVKPDKVTFIWILTACTHTGQVEEGRHYFYSMNNHHGIMHTVEHYLCMIDLLGRAGYLNEAEDLISNMPFEKVASAWSSLLGACRIHGDMERGTRAAERYLELEPHNAASYVSLSNVYVGNSRQDGA